MDAVHLPFNLIAILNILGMLWLTNNAEVSDEIVPCSGIDSFKDGILYSGKFGLIMEVLYSVYT